LYLLNQHDLYNTRAHIAQAFQPTETSTSFQKPKGPFNTASGFPRFAPIAKLYDHSYVQDDCIYFKVKIDMTDLKAPDYPAYYVNLLYHWVLALSHQNYAIKLRN